MNSKNFARRFSARRLAAPASPLAACARRIAAAALLMTAGSAFAGTFMWEAGLGYGQGKHIDVTYGGNHNSLLFDAAFGYRFDNGFGARAVGLGDGDPYRGLYSTDRSFDHFLGVQATGYLPL